jgi:hypothetical protein
MSGKFFTGTDREIRKISISGPASKKSRLNAWIFFGYSGTERMRTPWFDCVLPKPWRRRTPSTPALYF